MTATHDPMCHNPEDLPEGHSCGWCYIIAKVRRAIADGLKTALEPSEARDAAVTIALFATEKSEP
mgnify:CR=1 FL=1